MDCILIRKNIVVGERSMRSRRKISTTRRSQIVKFGGAHGSENVGMSSEMWAKTPHTEYLRFLRHCQSAEG